MEKEYKVALIGGGFVVAAALIGLIPVAITNHWFSSSPSSSGPAALSSPSSLSGLSSSTTGPSGQTSGATQPRGTVVSRGAGVQLANSSLNLTDPSLRPVPITSACGGDLYVCDAGAIVGSSQQLAVIDGKAGFRQCYADTSYVSTGNAETSGGSLVGKTLCVTTTDLIAVCYVTADTTQAGVTNPGLTMD